MRPITYQTGRPPTSSLFKYWQLEGRDDPLGKRAIQENNLQIFLGSGLSPRYPWVKPTTAHRTVFRHLFSASHVNRWKWTAREHQTVEQRA